MKRIIVSFLFLIPLFSFSQQWKRQRKEFILGIGATNFLGDLGGGNGIGTYYLKDLEVNETKSNVLAAYRYRYSQNIYFKGNLNYGRVSGSDFLTLQKTRRFRMLNFRSDIIELTGTFEYAITEERIRGRYIRGQSKFPVNIYTILGFGVTFFNPKAKLNDAAVPYVQGAEKGKWYALQPLHTEGQGMAGADMDKKYKRWSFVIPVGLGFKYPITNNWHIGMEYKLVKTFTDYIDDVGGYYYNNDAIKLQYGEIAAYFADPSIANDKAGIVDHNSKDYIPGASNAGQKRGNIAKNDSYMFGTLYVAYKIIKGQNKSRVKF